ncbi:hypothetical protein FRC11_005520 [Ceratobasidium sp. 423]|nr:hypothetical protein FRC11_005520 [Ceratobasidium sp. 423]
MSSATTQHIQTADTSVKVSRNEVDRGDEGTSAGGSVAPIPSAPPRKQARTTKTNRSKKNKENTVSGLLKLPLELFTEIMRELRPIDILNLSRTCKSFRNILMRRSSEAIWKRAAENLPYRLFPCPPWLDMPQYISVVYTDACSACGGKSQRKQSKWDPEFHPVLLVQKLEKEYNAKKLKSEKSFNAWKLSKSRAVVNYSRRPHWDLIEYVEQDRERQRIKLKLQFENSVQGRLKELGWEHDTLYAGGKEWWSLVKQPKNLTDRIWKNLYPKLQPILERARSQRLADLPEWKKKLLNDLWKDKHRDLGTQITIHPRHVHEGLKQVDARLVPPASQAMTWPCIKPILDSCLSHHDIMDRLPGSWEDVRPLAETWQRDIESQLASRLESDTSFTRPVSEDLNVLLRADSVFRFTDNTVRYFPADFLEIWRPENLYFWSDDLSVTSPPIVEGAQSFTSARQQAKALLQYIGLPNASHLGMGACGRRFICGKCVAWGHIEKSQEYTKIYDWKGLLAHYTSIQLNEVESGSILRAMHDAETMVGGCPPVYILSADDARKYAENMSGLFIEKSWQSYGEKHTFSARASAPGEQNESDNGSAETSVRSGIALDEYVPPRKQARQKKGNRFKKSERSSPAEILKLPVELFTEILRYIKPIDILNLSRTCKPLRGILMRRPSELVWKRAAENLRYTLPPCPPWLDMPQYISLVYTNACSACGGESQSKIRKVDPKFHPKLYIRLCASCQPNVLLATRDVPTHLQQFIVSAFVIILPAPGINLQHGLYSLRAEVQKLEEEYNVNAEEFKDEDYFNSWKLAKQSTMESYTGYFNMMRGLIKSIKQDQKLERDNLKREFERSVHEHLQELGWMPDINYITGREWDSLVKQPRNLTDRIWKNLYPKLQPQLEQARSRRLAELPLFQQKYLTELWDNKCHDLKTQALVRFRHSNANFKPAGVRLTPLAPEAMNWPRIKQILDLFPSHHDLRNFLPENWEDIRPLVEVWQRNVESKLATCLQEDVSFRGVSGPETRALVISGQPISGELDLLLRADSVFQFTDNTIRYFPRDFLKVWRPPRPWVTADFHGADSALVESAQPFTLARKQAKALLGCLGHPNATHLNMNMCGRRFVCGICTRWPPTEGLEIYDWSGLLKHYIDAQDSDQTARDRDQDIHYLVAGLHRPEFTNRQDFPLVHILSVDDTRVDPRKLFAEQPWLNYKFKRTCLHCTECNPLDPLDIPNHLRTTHLISAPEAHRDFENYEIYVRQSLDATYEYKS